MHRNQQFLYIQMTNRLRKNKGNNTFSQQPQKEKGVVILTKRVKGLYDKKNFKTLKKEMEEDIRRKVSHAHELVRLTQ